ncbi:unnamed protein product [Diamesa serratosioi]
MMHMHFWFGDDLGDFFIKGFVINSTRSMVLLSISLFILSVVYEGLKVHRAQSRAKTAREKRTIPSPSENANLLPVDSSSSNNLFQKPILKNILEGLSEMFTFLVHNVLNYFLMLCVMLFNGYLFIAVCLGMAVGYFLFGHLSMKTNMENLQAIQTKIICSARCAESDEPCSSMARTTPPSSHCPGMNADPSNFPSLKNFHTFKREPSESSSSSTDTSPIKK